MFPIFKKFKNSGKSQVKFSSQIKEIAGLSHNINKKNKALNELEYEILLERKDEVFLSLSDFLGLMDKKDISIKDILTVCKHISDIDKSKFSFIDVYPLVEENKIILSTEKDSSYIGNRIRIITMRVLKDDK